MTARSGLIYVRLATDDPVPHCVSAGCARTGAPLQVYETASRVRQGETSAPVRIGISACLLGERVRYDGSHRRDPFLVETLGRHVEWVPVCPELEMGLGVPRETLRLEQRGGEIRLLMPATGQDHTEAMRAYAGRRLGELAGQELCGYIFKKDSPSCGMERVRVYDSSGMPHGVPQKAGRGLFAAALMARFPELPVEEEARLWDPRLRENYIERVFAYRRLRSLFGQRWGLGVLNAFHTAHKRQLLAHSPAACRSLGRLVAEAKNLDRGRLRDTYAAEFMKALRIIATATRNANVLRHMLGCFTDRLDDGSRQEMVSAIEDYRKGLCPLVVPLTLVRHYARRFDVSDLKGQTYLEPHPKELMLRNHA